MDPHEVCKGLLRRDLCGECQQRENHQGDNVSDRCGRDVIAGRHKHRPLHRDVCKWHQAWQGSRDIFGSPFSRHHPSWWGRAGRHPLHERCDFGTCRGHGLDPWWTLWHCRRHQLLLALRVRVQTWLRSSRHKMRSWARCSSWLPQPRNDLWSKFCVVRVARPHLVYRPSLQCG